MNFEMMNEADVREEIVAPLLRRLGYRAGTNNNIIRELGLIYPRAQLGRRKQSDPVLRGKADYVCEAGGRVRWVVEAKAPSQQLDSLVRDQAYSYAVHPEVRAVLFAVTNGRQFMLFQTARGPDASPVLECSYVDLEAHFLAIESVLSPTAMLRDHKDVVVDCGVPLGVGLRSIERISSGRIWYTEMTPLVPPIANMVSSISGGSAQRLEDGSIEVSYEVQAPFQRIQSMNVRLGLDRQQLRCTDRMLSDDPARPSVLRAVRSAVIPVGTAALNIVDWTENTFPCDVLMNVEVEVAAHLKGRTVVGALSSSMVMTPPGVRFLIRGEFEVHLA